jgi:hypothetical protein
MPSAKNPTPVNFYLNEQHELSREERKGGGRFPQYYGIDWAAKGQRINAALESVRTAMAASHDPLRDLHYFVMAKPVQEILKKSKNKRLAPEGVITERVRFDESDSRIFRRLGMDLVEVTPEGSAIVHIEPERIKQLVATTQRLGDVGAREQARWASVDDFGVIPVELRLDDSWVRSLRPQSTTNAVVEFQPLLSRTDVEVLLRSIGALLRPDRKEAITSLGTDFSGRYWARGWITPESLKSIAKTFYCVQTLHSPLTSLIVASKVRDGVPRVQPSVAQPLADLTALPTVAVLDTGVPADHSILARYRRGTFVAPNSSGQALGDHGSFVASRVVFGDIDSRDRTPATNAGSCRYYDVLVATSVDEIDNKSVALAIQAVVGTAPDVRVFNLSFDTRLPLDQMAFTDKRENLLLVQDLDNLIFRDDILVIVSAGNSPKGVPPATPYPGHYDDPNWQLGAWARGFNSLACGSFVDKLATDGLVKNVGWPSPFTRAGPGLCNSPKPDFLNMAATRQLTGVLRQDLEYSGSMPPDFGKTIVELPLQLLCLHARLRLHSISYSASVFLVRGRTL